nr:InlB B-repeat-containing protein [uncultured Acetatifactor sp.]
MQEDRQNQEQMQEGQQQRPRGKWFGRGIYGSKDVPIRILDGVIGAMIVAVLIMVVYFTINGGFQITFDTLGGSQVEAQKLRHGELVSEPEEPYKPGYDFQGWYVEAQGEEIAWNFESQEVAGDVTLYAKWIPAQITVKFDLNGGLSQTGASELEPVTVTFGESYGTLPAVSKDGSVFVGWEYDGEIITADTTVQMTGEHVLTAVWE